MTSSRLPPNPYDPAPFPRSDANQIRAHAELILGSGPGCIELRVVGDKSCSEFRYRQTESGLYDDVDALVKDAIANHGKRAVYIGLNPRKVELLHAQPANTLKTGEAGKNEDVAEHRFLPIDIDTIRNVRKVAANEAELLRARPVFDAILADLESRGIKPICGFSGNGRHLVIRTIPYPVGPGISDKRGKISLLLNYFHRKFSTGTAEVDTGVFDPARVWKLYGTSAIKGANTVERPWRTAYFDIPTSSAANYDVLDIYGDEIEEQRRIEVRPCAQIGTRGTSRPYIDLVELFRRGK